MIEISRLKKDYFANNGPLAQSLTGFTPRAEQQQMASAVDDALENNSVLLAEAGTGTGKTFAYLVPAMASGKKVIISTGSKALQDQLFSKDLPLMQKALAYPHQVALLKGRSNYLCLERLAQVTRQNNGHSKETISALINIKRLSQGTLTGDIAELGPIAERGDVFPLITSTNDNCLGRDCPAYKDCYLVKARTRAMDANLIVVNHHLFFADMAVKDGGFGEILPNVDAYIFDEAHQLPDIATNYFGEQFSSRQLLDLCKDIELCYRTELKDMKQLSKAAAKLENQIKNFRLLFEGMQDKGEWRPLAKQARFSLGLKDLLDDISFAYAVLKLGLSRSELGDSCFERLAKQRLLLDKMTKVDEPGFSYWYETSRLHFSLNITPLNVSERFSNELDQRKATWVFTSATLAVNGGFDHFQQQLGLQRAKTLLLDSPFDYSTQAMLGVPRYMPDPREYRAEYKMLDQLLPLIEANQGRCFFLCTSHNMTKRIATALREQTELRVLMQGDYSKQQLLKEFINDGNAILVATATFWEGVDVAGDVLSLVIIDKLPFASPDDPLLKAKSEDCRLHGGDPFQQVYIPQAVIALKQGVGRLIRQHSDTGVVVICDNRLVNKEYGATFIGSLPKMPRTRDLDKLKQFIEKTN